MRYFSAFALLLLLCLRLPASAQSAADTVPGQSRFVQRLSAMLCQRIEDSAKVKNFTQLTPVQADNMFRQLMATGMSEQANGFVSLMEGAQKRNISNYNMGRAIGMATVMRLSAECPSSMALIVRTSSAQKAAGANAKNLIEVSAEEKAKLQPLTDSVCAELGAENGRRPFKQLSAAAREQKMTQVMQTVIMRNMPLMMTLYTNEQLSDEAEMQQFGLKIANLMLTKCPSYLMMLGQDNINKRQAAQSQAASRAKNAAPATKGKKPAPKPKPKVAAKPAPKKK